MNVNRMLFGSALAATLLVSAAAAEAANKCVDARGRVTYQDFPCDGAAAAGRSIDTSEALSTRPNRVGVSPQPGVGNGVDPAYADAHGAWRGPVQFQITVAGVRDGAAQQVTPMIIELKPDGEVTGTVPALDCRLKGLASQYVVPYMAQLDVSLQRCRDGRFNQRYSGQLSVNAAAREARLALNAVSAGRDFGKVQIASLQAVLKR